MGNVKLFGLPAERGRWFLIPLGIAVLLCLGTAYSWSIFRKPIETSLEVGATQSLLPFTTLLVVFSVLMPVTGYYIERFGPRRITAIGGVIMGIGYLASSFAHSIPALVLTYGVIAGIGVGITYGVPLAVTAKWFPDKKGIAVGTTVIGFGLSPLVTAPLARNLIAAYPPDGWKATLLIFGIAFTAIVLLASTTMKYPPTDWQPGGWQPPARTLAVTGDGTPMMQTRTFYGLWVCFIIGTFVGLAAIGIASPVGQEIVKLDAGMAAWTVSLFAVFNGLGRPFFGWVADRFTPKNAAIACYVLVIIASIMMLSAGEGSVATYLTAFCLITFSFGGWLAIAPTSTLILFRSTDYAKNYGIVFTAFGAGALLGTLTVGRIRDLFGSYTSFFYITGLLAIVGIVVAVFMLKRNPTVATELELGK
ncbi:OFA family MFS transporter [Oscillatoria sp. FACHB-1407]|uniref:L-lactate MFS transporter n=1 Tax=Oscillatoria sp. FACHB-1407 TaxID=2692847 RepID=UPI0016875E0A|nr:OFA family MFS transporter [Oscillatoria sp. FACHB-1407]MBD2464528.1 OFA family MFS transporter [Oscillatoria sp. FACHB-1407]